MKTGENAGSSWRFVIQKHEATTLHYDLRLEAEGVLKSWAVPKGPSLDPKQKRLAVPTEDHRPEYIDFEGVIPEGEYGAGTVLVWDTGTYINLTEKKGRPRSITEGIEDGHISFWLNGTKVRGGFALTRFRSGEQESWLLVKMRDEEADAGRDPVREAPDSVLTGRSLDAIRSEKGG